MGISWIVCWSFRYTDKHEITKDFWKPFDDYQEAKAAFDYLYNHGKIYSRSLTAVMESSDYDTHDAFKTPNQ